MSARTTTSRRTIDALDQRLSEAAKHLLDGPAGEEAPEGSAAALALPALVALCRRSGRTDHLWLLLTAVTGSFPLAADVARFRRMLELEHVEIVEQALLRHALHASGSGRLDLPMRVVREPVVDVDTCARLDYQSGIHRVVRETVTRWSTAHRLHLVAWDDTYRVFRTLAPQERARVLDYGASSGEGAARSGPSVLAGAGPVTEDDYVPELVVPWNTVVVAPDVPVGPPATCLAALAQHSGSELAVIGYDLIPVTSADLRPLSDAVAAGEWLRATKTAHRIAAISRSAAEEFSGLSTMLGAQGLTGPDVAEVMLPTSTTPPWFDAGRPAPSRTRPVVLFTGTREPHKNHRSLLHAASRLWAEGLDFEVHLVGGRGWTETHLKGPVADLVAQGRPLVDLGRVSEEQLWYMLAGADAVAFASLHEGFGLPVAEALAVGTPVITTSYGSQGEIAAGGGCLVVDPRDDDSITDALRRMVTEPALRAELAAQARNRAPRTWDDYAEEAWDYLVGSTSPVEESR